MSVNYAKAGVDLSKHREMHKIALKTIEEVAEKLGAKLGGISRFAPHVLLGGSELALHVDGVGTKTIILQKLGALEVAGWDCIAMNVNDLACGGFKTIAISDYIAIGESNPILFEQVMKGLAKAALYVKAPIISGETAILPGLLNGVDVVCFAIGVKHAQIPGVAGEGDVVVGVESWGLHANGFSLVRKIIEEKIGRYDAVIDGLDLARELTKPTAIYHDLVLEAGKRGLISSATHVTGGGWSKAKRALGENLDMVLKPPRPPRIFEFLSSIGGVSIDEMYRVFNMGIGLILTTRPENLEHLVQLIHQMGFNPHVLGRVVPGSGLIHLEVEEYGVKIQI
jgi:phosphoribosylformylglycinamidine cyclo-ligase